MAVAISQASPARLTNLQPLWHRTAPRQLAEKCPAEDPLVGWTAWQKYLARRRRPAAPPFLHGKRPPIRWGWPDAWKQNDSTPLTGMDLPEALRTVELAYKLPVLARELPGDAWWQLVEQLHDTAVSALAERIEWPGDPRQVLRSQLLAGELPLALSYLFPEIRSLRELRTNARTALSESMAALTDGRGLPHARLLPVFAPLFACWTRVRWLGERMKLGCWSGEAEYQYRWLVYQALRLLDADGRFMLTPSDRSATQTRPHDMFATALELMDSRKLFAAAKAMLPKRVTPLHARSSAEDLPARSYDSDWSGIAILSEGWKRSDAQLALAFADDPVRIELAIGRDKLIAGDWTCETTCDGTPVRVAGEWEELSWESDKRFDYIELGVELTEGLRLERQLLLARDDRVLFLADTLLSSSDSPRQLCHTIRLPLGPHAAWKPERETRDGVLTAGKRRAAVLPLALQEWRSDPRGGSLSAESGQLVLTQDVTGRGLCCPLVIDLKPGRSKRERTWRQLTVAESLEIVPRDVAVGFRAQSGRDQWIFYRALSRAANRTLIGYNIAGEFAAGRFLTSGKVKEWLEVEAV